MVVRPLRDIKLTFSLCMTCDEITLLHGGVHLIIYMLTMLLGVVRRYWMAVPTKKTNEYSKEHENGRRSISVKWAMQNEGDSSGGGTMVY